MGRLFAASAGILAYVFIGYPLLMALAARLRPRSRPAQEFTPAVSLIISAYNEADHLAEKLENCRELDYPASLLDVIVVADGSTDSTAEIARREGARVLFDPERRGKMSAISRGVAAARNDVFVLSDANNHYTPGSLRALVAPLADPHVGVVTGRKQIETGGGRSLDSAEGLYSTYEAKLKDWESRVGSVTSVAGEIMAIRRRAFTAPQENTVNDDFVVAMNAAIDGWRVVYADDAISLERASADVGEEALRRARIVTGRWQALARVLPAMIVRRPLLAWQVVSHKGLRLVVPYALLTLALSSAVAARRARWARCAGIVQAVFYITAVLGWRSDRPGKRNRIFFVPYYFCRVNGATVTGLRRLIRGGDHVRWEKVRRG